MQITNLKCAVLGDSPIVRVVTDEGVDGFGEIESAKPYLGPVVEMYRPFLLGEDPTDIERCMLKIRRFAGFKPWGSAVSAIEIALWDLLGKVSGLPVHKLLGGKVRDRVRVYNGGVRPELRGHTPEDYAAAMREMKAAPEGFTIIKEGVGFHGFMAPNVPDFFYGDLRTGPRHPNRGTLTERGLNHVVDTVAAMKEVLGDEVGLALDMGPGWTVADAIRVGRALEPHQVMWMEDLLTGDYVPWVHADQFREVTRSTSTPTHTGEQIYLRHNFRELIETNAVRVIGPDPCDVGGLAELKWVAEYADLHGIGIAPHGVLDGVLGLAALVQVCATLPDNFIAFEYPVARPDWWYEIVHGLPDPIVRDGFVEVGDAPGLGVTIDPQAARPHLRPAEEDFFSWDQADQ
ncbi:mandelate racemase/muconate lactonizing enzyme family protein [Amycolatopsis endophytica]|uniref:L-alanine-DL-glutamate epimerase-like enolase superfamily enzyme n=1 Tax=Amycolatopsis endophytica TaxID=860233 RepID=A0A853BBA3_9PSEU|nr:mandelate racemase/muconate lactonizing enzyme family protein [Amycolatopsis endophytica]NYI92300.1 L-alanine-DL-glutamate epimerase-like enolase superfamily enzyme [Amycolatopsis endophytica]